jgi:hypothetical protein
MMRLAGYGMKKILSGFWGNWWMTLPGVRKYPGTRKK